jgi:hypothetical protein
MNQSKETHDAIWKKAQAFKARSNSMVDFVVSNEIEKKGAADLDELSLRMRITVSELKMTLNHALFRFTGNTARFA